MLKRMKLKIGNYITVASYKRIIEVVAGSQGEDVSDSFIPYILGYSYVSIVVSQDSLEGDFEKTTQNWELKEINQMGVVVEYEHIKSKQNNTDFYMWGEIKRWRFTIPRKITEETIDKLQKLEVKNEE